MARKYPNAAAEWGYFTADLTRTFPMSGKFTARQKAIYDLVLGTLEALVAERGADEKIWGSMVKQALKRRKPGFNESYYGFRSFNDLLEEARERNLLELERDEKSGGYIVREIYE